MLREISRRLEMTIYARAINRDHVHMLIGIPPQVSVPKAVQYLKGKGSHRMLFRIAQALLGSPSVVPGLLGGNERQRHG